MKSYEIEIKSLLGSEERAAALREKLRACGAELRSQSTQRNHYFVGGEMEKLSKAVSAYLKKGAQEKLSHIIEAGKNFSVRTREADGKVYLVVKASVDSTTSQNGISRMEFEEEVSLSLSELDQILLECGFSYQAKWSRKREEYECRDSKVCLDKNAGYGYVAEFERVVGDGIDRDAVLTELRTFMREMEVEELPQDRLERMFAHYNEHWPEYYGTDKIFLIE